MKDWIKKTMAEEDERLNKVKIAKNKKDNDWENLETLEFKKMEKI